MSIDRIAAAAIVAVTAGAVAAPASAELLTRKDLSMDVALTIATTAIATCKAQGLTGSQGVLVPAANVQNLMLDEEIVEAAREGTFHVWAVRTIDEGIELLTRRPAGRRRADGSYPPDSVHGLVAARLADYAERMRAFAETDGDAGGRRELSAP